MLADVTAKDWFDLSANIATIVLALTGIGAAIFASCQLASMKRSREVDTFLNIINQGNGELVRSAANWLKHEMSSTMTYEQAMQPDNRERIATVVHHFEMIGILVEQGYISANLVYDQMGPWVVGTWGKLQEIISTHRIKKQAPDYAENFEILAQGYEKWSRINPAKLEKRGRATHTALQSYYKHVSQPPPPNA